MRLAGHWADHPGFALTLLLLCAVGGPSPALSDGRIVFARGAPVPPAVREFAWRVIETHCRYQPYEREQRSFWAYHARKWSADTETVYSISILSDLPWEKTEPPAVVEMTIIDDGGPRLAALRSSFAVCSP